MGGGCLSAVSGFIHSFGIENWSPRVVLRFGCFAVFLRLRRDLRYLHRYHLAAWKEPRAGMPGGLASRPGTPNPCLRQDLKVSGLVTTRQKMWAIRGLVPSLPTFAYGE